MTVQYTYEADGETKTVTTEEKNIRYDFCVVLVSKPPSDYEIYKFPPGVASKHRRYDLAEKQIALWFTASDFNDGCILAVGTRQANNRGDDD